MGYSIKQVTTSQQTLVSTFIVLDQDGVTPIAVEETQADAQRIVDSLTAAYIRGAGTVTQTPPPPPVDPPPVVIPPPPVPGAMPTTALGLMGPGLPLATLISMGEPWRTYADNFSKFIAIDWPASDFAWDRNYRDYYDQAASLWVMAELDPPNAAKWRTMAKSIADNYRTKYIEANNYGSSDYWWQPAGMALDFILNKNEAARVAVGRVSDNLNSGWWLSGLDGSGDSAAQVDGRSGARMLISNVFAKIIGAKSGQGFDWTAQAKKILTAILGHQDADGGLRFVASQKVMVPFQVGLIHDAMIMHYDWIDRDPRIMPAIRRSIDCIAKTCWIESAGAIAYAEAAYSVPNGSGDRSPAPDLNHMLTAGVGRIYKETKVADYKTFGDKLFAGGVAGAFLGGKLDQGGKQFNESYSTGFRYPALRS